MAHREALDEIVGHALAEAMENGHCGLAVDELMALTGKLIEDPDRTHRNRARTGAGPGEVVADTVAVCGACPRRPL